MDKIFWIFAGAVIGWTVTNWFIQNKQFKTIIKKLTMSQETLDQLTGKVNAVTTSLTNIKEDITRIKDGLPTSGGLTEAEVAALHTQLDAAVATADSLDKENEPESPTE